MNPVTETAATRRAQSFSSPLDAVKPGYHIPLLLAFAVVARMAVFHADQIIFSWRSTDMAGIAMNYYRNGFHFLHPQVLWGGNGPGFVEMEFPIIPFLLAVLYKLFGVHDWLALIIPMTSGLGLVVVVYLFARQVFGPAAGFVAGLFAASPPPLAALSVALWPDPPMIFFGTLGIYSLVRWSQNDSWGYFVMGACATALAILLKLTALYLGIPILYLCLVKFGPGFWKKPWVWLLAFLILAPSGIWYFYAHTLYLGYHNTFGILSGGYLKFADSEILLDPAFYGMSLLRMIVYHFTPVVFALFLYGILTSQREKIHYVFHIWFGAVLLYLCVAAKGVWIGHFQYMLPVVPPGAILAGAGTVSLLRKLDTLPRLAGWPKSSWSVGLALMFLGGTAVADHVYESPETYTVKTWSHDRETGLAVARVTAPGSLIMVVDNQMGGEPDRIMTPPNVFYFSDRRGWYVALSWLTEDLVEQRRSEGARYLVITGNTISLFEASCVPVKTYLSSHYALVLDTPEGVVYDLAVRKEPKPMSG